MRPIANTLLTRDWTEGARLTAVVSRSPGTEVAPERESLTAPLLARGAGRWAPPSRTPSERRRRQIPDSRCSP